MLGFDPEIAAAQTASAAAPSRHELALSPLLGRRLRFGGTLTKLAFVPYRSDPANSPTRLPRSQRAHDKRAQRKEKPACFSTSCPVFPKNRGTFPPPLRTTEKKAFHPAPKSGETLFFMRCPRNLACGGGAQPSIRRAVQPSTHCATACATPSSSLESVTRSATAFTSSAALAIATPMPAKRNMARSLKPSPNAMSCSRDKPR